MTRWTRGVLSDSASTMTRSVGAERPRNGSSAVPGLLGKPVVDLVLGLTADVQLDRVTAALESTGWIYRGDAGAAAGHVFVLETRPWHRVAHLHAVELGGHQWLNHLRFRDLLRSSSDARDTYEVEKLRLAEQHGNDRPAYTEGKTHVVTSLLAGLRRTRSGSRW